MTCSGADTRHEDIWARVGEISASLEEDSFWNHHAQYCSKLHMQMSGFIIVITTAAPLWDSLSIAGWHFSLGSYEIKGNLGSKVVLRKEKLHS